MAVETYAYKIDRAGSEKILRINYEGSITSPSIEDNPSDMARVFNIMLESGKIHQIVFVQKEEFIYDHSQAGMINELVEAFIKLVKEENIMLFSARRENERFLPVWHEILRQIVLQKLKEDPIGAYVDAKRRAREERIKKAEEVAPGYSQVVDEFIQKLDRISEVLETTRLIKHVEKRLPGHKVGERELYREIFKPAIRPYFMFTKVVTAYPTGAEELEHYKVAEDADVLILRVPHDLRPIYHIIPPEFKLPEDRYDLLGTAKQVMEEHRPERSEFIDPQRTREIFFDIEKDLISDIAKSKGMEVSYDELNKLTKILLRYTVGFGILELILSDPKIQDVVVNAPLGHRTISLIHADYDECLTNVTPTPREGASWGTKLRMLSGRPLDEANPVLDTDLLVPGGKARVAAIQRPLSPAGMAFAFRRHRDKPWTLPLFIREKMITPLAAGLFSFIVDGARTILIAGTRSAGKTSLLSSLMVEIMRSNRIITCEDTLELPVAQLRGLNYDIQSMKVSSVITGGAGEMSAAQGIRTTLRLGDSALIVGEVRSEEAKALYEAMRVGALAKVVAGTIHGADPYGVYDRVVNDLGVQKTSFKATDIIIVANPITSPSGLQRYRRVTQVSEIRKHWTDDPVREHGFADLLKYDANKDSLDATDIFLEGESEILKSIGANVREWAGSWDAIWENIELRAKVKQAIVDIAKQSGKDDLLEAEFVVLSNDMFHKISGEVQKEVGYTESKRVYREWEHLLKKEVKHRLKNG